MGTGMTNLKNLTDQPGRVLAIFVFAPLILFKGLKYQDAFLIVFAILLFIWDLYWLLFKAPNKQVKKENEFNYLNTTSTSHPG